MLLHSVGYGSRQGNKGVLQPVLRPGTALWAAGRSFRPVAEKGYSTLDEEQRVSLWLFDFLFRHVFCDALQYVSGVCRSAGYGAGGYATMDVQIAVALGLSWNAFARRGGAICLRVLWRDVDIHGARVDHDGTVQAT